MTRLAARRLLVALLALALLTVLAVRGEGRTTLPVVTITADSLTDWDGKEDVRQATLSYEDGATGLRFTQPITIHIQGATSAHKDKKNFTIKLEEKLELRKGWGAHKKYCLKANYIDPTHAVNIVSARLAAQMQRQYALFDRAPNAGQVDGFPVWLELNGEPAGLYTWNIPKDEWLLGMDKANPDHIAMFGKSWKGCTAFATEKNNYKQGWIFKVGEKNRENKEKFMRMYQFVRTASDEEFRANFDQYLDLDACLNYYCYVCISYAPDNLAKNMLLATYDGIHWAPCLYDLDSLWGIDWKGTGLWAVDDAYSVEDVIHCTGLLGRIRDCFPDEVRARYAELRRYPLSRENIRAEFERFRAEIPQDYYDSDRALWYTDGTNIRTYERTYSLIDEYLPTVDAAFGYVETP